MNHFGLFIGKDRLLSRPRRYRVSWIYVRDYRDARIVCLRSETVRSFSRPVVSRLFSRISVAISCRDSWLPPFKLFVLDLRQSLTAQVSREFFPIHNFSAALSLEIPRITRFSQLANGIFDLKCLEAVTLRVNTHQGNG